MAPSLSLPMVPCTSRSNPGSRCPCQTGLKQPDSDEAETILDTVEWRSYRVGDGNFWLRAFLHHSAFVPCSAMAFSPFVMGTILLATAWFLGLGQWPQREHFLQFTYRASLQQFCTDDEYALSPLLEWRWLSATWDRSACIIVDVLYNLSLSSEPLSAAIATYPSPPAGQSDLV